jgi:hypothetical protein
MNPKAVLSAAVSVLLLAGCDAASGADKIMDPSAIKWNPDAIVYTESIKDVPWESSDTHPCKPDQIAITGSSHWVIHTGFDNLGGFHYMANIVSKGTGLGTSGKVYKIMEHFKDAEQAPGNYTSFVIYDTQRLKVDGPSTDYDYYKTTILKIVVNATGEPVISVVSEANSCS